MHLVLHGESNSVKEGSTWLFIGLLFKSADVAKSNASKAYKRTKGYSGIIVVCCVVMERYLMDGGCVISNSIGNTYFREEKGDSCGGGGEARYFRFNKYTSKI